MNEEEKKAVKYFYNLRATIDESNMLFDEEINVKHGKETIKQITIILNLIEKLQKENEELKEENEYNKILLDMNNNFTIDKKTGIYKWNVIEIQKVKDKIEELKKKVEELTDEKGYWGGSDLLEQIKVLQELLEKEQ